MSHTYAVLGVSPEAYEEIARKLREAEYWHVFVDGVIDMHEIALNREPEQPERKGNCGRCGALIYLEHPHICNTMRSNFEIMQGDS